MEVALESNYDLGGTFWGSAFLLRREDTSISISQASAQLSLSKTSVRLPVRRRRRRNCLRPEDTRPLWLIQLYFYHTSLVKVTGLPMNQFTWADRAPERSPPVNRQHAPYPSILSQPFPPSGCAPCLSTSKGPTSCCLCPSLRPSLSHET